MLKILFFVAVSKNEFSSQTEWFFFRLRPLAPPIGAVRTAVFRPKKFWTRKKSENMLKVLFFVAVSKNVFVPKTERFSRSFFVFGPWCPLLGVCTEKVEFPSLGGRSGRNTRRPNLIAR